MLRIRSVFSVSPQIRCCCDHSAYSRRNVLNQWTPIHRLYPELPANCVSTTAHRQPLVLQLHHIPLHLLQPVPSRSATATPPSSRGDVQFIRRSIRLHIGGSVAVDYGLPFNSKIDRFLSRRQRNGLSLSLYPQRTYPLSLCPKLH